MLSNFFTQLFIVFKLVKLFNDFVQAQLKALNVAYPLVFKLAEPFEHRVHVRACANVLLGLRVLLLQKL